MIGSEANAASADIAQRPTHASYPGPDIEAAASASFKPAVCAAVVSEVEPYSPADDAGFEPGCKITAVDGHPLRDLIEWRWLTDGDEILLSYIDLDGDAGEVLLERDEGQTWGFTFEGLVFDEVRQCRNACTFCFMHQLPRGLRPSLTLRDDDYRLSFLVGTFVTLTNLRPEDEERIVQQRITPLHVSLQASDPDVRRALIGRHAAHGLAAFDRLLSQGIQAHVQIVLVPEVNDGAELEKTLDWAYARPGILDVGIVPLGYTRFQTRFDRSFNDPQAARRVLDDVFPYQQRALAERGHAWAYAADEFYSNAYGRQLLENLPEAPFYQNFELFEDGIGIIRSTVDDWRAAQRSGAVDACARALAEAHVQAKLLVGTAQRDFLDPLIERSALNGRLSALYVENDFFGGNVNVTGLLVGQDVARAVRNDMARLDAGAGARRVAATIYAIQDVVFNDDGIMLDDMRLEDMEKAAGTSIAVVSCSPLEYLNQLAERARELGDGDMPR